MPYFLAREDQLTLVCDGHDVASSRSCDYPNVSTPFFNRLFGLLRIAFEGVSGLPLF